MGGSSWPSDPSASGSGSASRWASRRWPPTRALRQTASGSSIATSCDRSSPSASGPGQAPNGRQRSRQRRFPAARFATSPRRSPRRRRRPSRWTSRSSTRCSGNPPGRVPVRVRADAAVDPHRASAARRAHRCGPRGAGLRSGRRCSAALRGRGVATAPGDRTTRQTAPRPRRSARWSRRLAARGWTSPGRRRSQYSPRAPWQAQAARPG